MKTQIAFSDKLNQGKYAALSEQAKRLGVVRSEVWQRFGLVKGKRIAIPLSTNVVPKGNLRLILRNEKIEVHYAVEVIKTNDCGTQIIGVDKGFTEALTDSDGVHHGVNLGEVLSKESDRLKLKYQRRHKLQAIAKKKPHVQKHTKDVKS